MGLKAAVKQFCVKKNEKRYQKLLSGKKVGYDTWIKKQEKVKATTGETQDYVLLLQKGGTLSPMAHTWITRFFQEHPQVQILYGDEDLLGENGKRENPWYKPCWSPDTYLSQYYVGSAVAVRKELVELIWELSEEEAFTGRIMFDDPAEVRERLTKALRTCGAFGKESDCVGRCPHMLFTANDLKVWDSYLQSKEKEEILYGELNDISVIIPSKDNPAVLAKCVESLKKIPGLEIIIVDNGSSQENKDKVSMLVDSVNTDIQRKQSSRYLYYPMEFNFSKMCNMGARAAFGKYLLLLNDDIEACGTEWIYAMRQKAAKPYVGAVGLKLYYPEGNRIQHAGITNLPVGPVHKMQFAEDDKSIYFDKNRADVNCLAVTGACLMIEKGKYGEVGGLKEALRVAYNDVELGFALYEAGYQNVVLNSYYAYHHESLSRGNDDSREKLERLINEREKLYQMHPDLKDKDPYYPEGLSQDGLDSRIVPAYVNAYNTVQAGVVKKTNIDLSKVRVDKCLFLGIELSKEKHLKGYGVVLGDNNACYDRYLVLAKDEKGDKADGKGKIPVLLIETQPQYRQDLEENMAEQINVAMSGFHVCIGGSAEKAFEKGAVYRIGVMAVNRVNKGKLLNWSERFITV